MLFSILSQRLIIVRKFSRYQSTALSSARIRLLNASLQNVTQFGWSEEAIREGILAENLPISMIGLVTPSELVHWFMEDTNQRFASKLDNLDMKELSIEDRIVMAIKARLKYIVPYRSKWHEGMALGATENTLTTANQLEEIVSLISLRVLRECQIGRPPFSSVEKTAIGAVYVTTELHLLMDESNDQQKSWQFLRERVHELHQMALLEGGNSFFCDDLIASASAVTTSLGGGAASLMFHPPRGGSPLLSNNSIVSASAVAKSLFGGAASLMFQLPRNETTFSFFPSFSATPPRVTSHTYLDLPPLPIKDTNLLTQIEPIKAK